MAQPISAQNPIVVVGDKYCSSEYPIELLIKRKVKALSFGNLSVKDVNQNLVFNLEAQWSLHDHRILRDPAGNPILTLRQKIRSMHAKWHVYRGDSREEKDLLFTAKSTSKLQFKTKMDIFLAGNVEQEVPDFRLEGSYSERYGTVYAGDGQSKIIIGQMHKKHTLQSVFLGMHKFRVTVYPNVDYAFIVALISILDAIDVADGS